jgi:hypothetical protein
LEGRFMAQVREKEEREDAGCNSREEKNGVEKDDAQKKWKVFSKKTKTKTDRESEISRVYKKRPLKFKTRFL